MQHWKAHLLNMLFAFAAVIAIQIDDRPVQFIAELLAPFQQGYVPTPDPCDYAIGDPEKPEAVCILEAGVVSYEHATG